MVSTAGAKTAATPQGSSSARSLAEVARVLREVLARPELRRVDEDRHDDRPERGAAAHQREVALVQRAHGRHEDQRPLAAQAVQGRAGRARVRRTGIGHAWPFSSPKACSGPGKPPARTSAA